MTMTVAMWACSSVRGPFCMCVLTLDTEAVVHVCVCVSLQSPMPEALQKALNSKKRGNKDRFGGMSVEGRGIII